MAINEEISFSASFDQATKDIKAFTKAANEQISKVGDAFALLGGIAKATVALFAAREVVSAIEEVTKAAAEQEQVLQNLKSALALTGEFSDDAVKHFQDFADQIQKTTKFDDDLVLSQLAIAKSFGLTNVGAEKLVKTATDLAAATGVSLDTAVQELGRTLTGTTGALGKTIPGIKSLSTESLKSGAAIDLVAKRFGGAAAAQLNTFQGSLVQVGNAFQDLYKALGAAIVQNPVVIGAFKVLSEIVNELTIFIQENQSTLKEFVGNFVKLAFDVVPYLLQGLQILVEYLGTLIELLFRIDVVIVSFIKDLLQFQIVQDVLDDVYKAFTTLVYIIIQAAKGFTLLAEYIPGFSDKAEGLTASLQGVADALAEATGNGIDFKEVGDVVDTVKDSFSKAADTTRQFTESTVIGLDKGISRARELANAISKINPNAKKDKSQDPKNIKSDFSQLLSNIVSAFKTGAEYVAKVLSVAFQVIGGLFSGDYINKFAGFVQQIGEFPKAILDAMKNLDGIIDNLLEQLPQFIKDFLAQIPKLVEDFTKSFPKLVDTLLQALPGIVQTFTDAVGPIVKTIITAIPKIIDAIPALIDETLQALPGVIDTILRGLPAIITSILKAIPKIINSIIKELPAIVSAISNDLPDIVTALITGIIGGAGDIAIGLTDAFIVKGGLFKMIGATIAAIPKVIVALVKAFVGATKSLGLALVGYVTGVLGKIFGGLFKSGDLRDILTGKKLADGIKKLFSNGEVRDVLTGKKFIDGLKKGFNNPELRDILTGKKFYDTVFKLFKNPELRDIMTGKKFYDTILNLFKKGDLIDILTGKKLFDGIRDLFKKGDLLDILTGKKLFDSIKDAFEKIDFIDKLKSLFKEPPFLKKLKDILSAGIGGGGKKGGALGKWSGGKLATGGMGLVNKVPLGFNDDTFPAQLTSGELVIDRTTASKLSDFLNGKATGGGFDLSALADLINNRPLVVNVQVSDQQIAQAVFNAKRRGYRT